MAGTSDSELQQFVNRNLSTNRARRSSTRQYYWGLTICAHCRRWAPTTKVLACCQMGAHHREVKLVDARGARQSIGVLTPASEQLVHRTTHVLPASRGKLRLGTIVDLDPDSTVKVDERVTFIVGCEECAGLSLGECIDKGHNQLVSFFSVLASHVRCWRVLCLVFPMKSNKRRYARCGGGLSSRVRFPSG